MLMQAILVLNLLNFGSGGGGGGVGFVSVDNMHVQCCQAEDQTEKSQNQTFIRPYFYQKTDQKRTPTRHFRGQNQNGSKTQFRHK